MKVLNAIYERCVDATGVIKQNHSTLLQTFIMYTELKQKAASEGNKADWLVSTLSHLWCDQFL